MKWRITLKAFGRQLYQLDTGDLSEAEAEEQLQKVREQYAKNRLTKNLQLELTKEALP